MKLENRIAIITGGGRGIGRSTALAFAREGADIVLAARTDTEINTVAEEVKQLGRRALAIKTDIQLKTDVDAMVAQTLDTFGKVDILVNNAGVAIHNPIPKIREEDWDLTMAVNLKGCFSRRKPSSAIYVSRSMGISSMFPPSLASLGMSTVGRIVPLNSQLSASPKQRIMRADRTGSKPRLSVRGLWIPRCAEITIQMT